MPVEKLLIIENISKSFGIVQALKNVSFSINKGEIHSVLGENGAGKSTLVKIIRGEYRQDSGRLIFEDNEIKISDPLYANSLGITMVHQELTLFENLTVAENIYPNNVFRTRIGLINRKEMLKKASEKLKLFELNINPSEKVVNLSLANQQMIEILRAIGMSKKLIIMDEPTSGLNEVEVKSLMGILKRLRDAQISILYISHRIPEVIEISNRITVLKDGYYVDTIENKNLKENQIIGMMVGHEVDLLYKRKIYKKLDKKEVFLEINNLNKKNSIFNINFNLYKGEIVGVFGLEGSGIDKFSQVIFGLDDFESGEIKIGKKSFKKISTDLMIKNGVIYLNKNRKIAGLFTDMSSSDNMACPVLKKYSKAGFLNFNMIRKYAELYIKRFNIAIPGTGTKPKNLSGGNQQKLMLSICMGTIPKCFIVNEPTRGIDVGAKAEIHKFILEQQKENLSVLIFSSELPELLSLCDRVIIMKNNTIAGELSGNDITEESMMLIAAGSDNKKAS